MLIKRCRDVCSMGEVLEGIHITMPYSIASYMVRDFLKEGSPAGTVDEQLVGTLTGILVGAQTCQCIYHSATHQPHTSHCNDMRILYPIQSYCCTHSAG